MNFWRHWKALDSMSRPMVGAWPMCRRRPSVFCRAFAAVPLDSLQTLDATFVCRRAAA
jgi:hypothetical protein